MCWVSDYIEAPGVLEVYYIKYHTMVQDIHTHAHTKNANHKDCKVGEVVAVASHCISIHFYCLTTLCCPLCVNRENSSLVHVK